MCCGRNAARLRPRRSAPMSRTDSARRLRLRSARKMELPMRPAGFAGPEERRSPAPAGCSESRPLLTCAVPSAVHGRNVKLRLRFEWREPHLRPGCRLGDRCGVEIVILLRLDVRPDVFARGQPDLVALGDGKVPKMMAPHHVSPTTKLLSLELPFTPAEAAQAVIDGNRGTAQKAMRSSPLARDGLYSVRTTT